MHKHTLLHYCSLHRDTTLLHISVQSNTTYMPHMPNSSCADITQLCQYIPHMNSLQSQCHQEHWYIYFSHYCHLPLNKSDSHILHICSTTLIIYSTYRAQIIANISKNTQQTAFFLPYDNHICPNIKYANQMLYICHIWQ